MLEYSVYSTSLYMIAERGFEEVEDIIEQVSKANPDSFTEDKSLHNIGYNFQAHLKSDLRESESRFMMSYCIKSRRLNTKQFVIFGQTNKAFLTTLTDIMLEDHEGYTPVFNIVLPKEYNTKTEQRLDVMGNKVTIIRFMDKDLIKPPVHALGPRYEIMTDSEVETLTKTLYINKSKMKRILASDPAMKYIGAVSKMGVRIIRTPNIKGSLIKEMIDYRLVQ